MTGVRSLSLAVLHPVLATCVAACLALTSQVALAAEQPGQGAKGEYGAQTVQDSNRDVNGVTVLEAFDRQQQERVNAASELTDKRKHTIMFMLAIPLFILLLATGSLGIATGVYGKRMFIPHMVCAGLTFTLAIAHVIAGLVWFYPF